MIYPGLWLSWLVLPTQVSPASSPLFLLPVLFFPASPLLPLFFQQFYFLHSLLYSFLAFCTHCLCSLHSIFIPGLLAILFPSTSFWPLLSLIAHPLFILHYLPPSAVLFPCFAPISPLHFCSSLHFSLLLLSLPLLCSPVPLIFHSFPFFLLSSHSPSGLLFSSLPFPSGLFAPISFLLFHSHSCTLLLTVLNPLFSILSIVPLFQIPTVLLS